MGVYQSSSNLPAPINVGSTAQSKVGYLAIGTSTAPTIPLDVFGAIRVKDGAVLFSGTTGSTPVSGAGTRLMWIPAKAAFRAGYVESNEWDDANIGDYSFASGYGTTASEYGSTAMGDGTTASEWASTAMGYETNASGDASTAMGYETIASGDESTAMGEGTIASGRNSTAMGEYTTASGWASTAMGEYTTASGWVSTAMGGYTTASGDASTAMGDWTTASGYNSTAMGEGTIASGMMSIAIGREIEARGAYTIAIALNDQNGTVVAASHTMAIMGGNVGIGTTTPNNLLSVYQLIDFNNTDFNTKLGYQAGKNIVSGAQYNTFVGYQAGMASSTGSYLTDNAYNTAVGYQSLYSNKTGFENTAIGIDSLYSNIEGFDNTAVGAYALRSNTGDDNTAMGVSALQKNTTGSYNIAIGDSALYENTEGVGNTAMGGGALDANTTGNKNIAIGMDALGENTTGNYNSAMGVSILRFTKIGSNNTALGWKAGYGVAGGNIQNSVLVGYQAGYALATSSSNILLGYQAGDNLTTGSNNIILGYDIDLPTISSSNMLNIGNLIYATGLTSTSTIVSTGNVGIGTTTPSEKLVVAGNIKITGKIYGGTSCPSDMVYIPGDQPFCIDKYEAYKVSGTVVNSTCATGTQAEVDANTTTAIAGSATGQTPLVSINWCAAKKMCQNAGKHLCTNPEWFQACNYKGSQWNITAEQSAEAMACNTDTAAAALTGASPGCITQEGAYDMIGNVWEFVDKVVTADPTNGLTSNNYITGYDFATALPTSIGATSNAYGNDMYWYYTGAGSPRMLYRGGAYNQSANSGCFTLVLSNPPSTTSSLFGFRCCQ